MSLSRFREVYAEVPRKHRRQSTELGVIISGDGLVRLSRRMGLGDDYVLYDLGVKG